ncbi:MAG: DinB family protein [Blastocatellia bacterium]|nr:DinB family protein [Blastocatellia bacterium]
MQKIIERLDEIRKELLDKVSPIDPKTFEKRPAENQWSIAEVIHHLALVEGHVTKEIEKRLSEPPRSLSTLRRLFQPPLWLVDVRLVKVKAPKRLEPLDVAPKEQNLKNLVQVRQTLKDLAVKTGRDRLENIVIPHPFLGDYDGAQFVEFVGCHETRHLKQIKEIIAKVG